MAESYIAYTPGSGGKIHTFNRTVGANSVEEEASHVAEPYLATYTVTSGARSIATNGSHVLALMAGASLPVYVRRIVVYQAVAASTGQVCGFQVMRLTSAGDTGTTITPVKLDTTDSAAGCSALALPTNKGTETDTIWEAWSYLQQTYGASTPQGQPILDLDFDRLRSKAIRIPAGTSNGIAFANRAAIAGCSLSVVMLVSEASF